MSVWQRDMGAPPTEPFEGVLFRSHLELAVAKELSALDVFWDYEVCPWCIRKVRPVESPPRRCACTGGPVNYLPDFRILIADAELDLPQWVEVKPAELLYAVRDALGLPEDLGGEACAVATTSDQWSKSDVAEIHKPLALAERTGKSVLVVSAINRHRTLSVLCGPGGMTLSKWHPAVNWKGHQRRVEQEANRRRWEAERVEREREWAAKEAQLQQQRQDTAAYMRRLAAMGPGMPARYDGLCYVCSTSQTAENLLLHRVQDRWIGVCRPCAASARGERPTPDPCPSCDGTHPPGLCPAEL